MRQRLTIGLLQPQPGWLLLLGQLGVAFERVGMLDPVTPESHGVLIVNRSLSSDEAAQIDAYLHGGGAVLDTGAYMEHAGGSSSRSYVRSLIPSDDDRLFTDAWIMDIHDIVHTRSDARYLNGALLFDHVGDGAVAWTGLNINRLITSTNAVRKRFPAPGRSFPDEIVSQVSKGALRELVGNLLRRLFTARGLPWIRLWQFPDELPTIFAYRIDSDYGTKPQIEGLYDVAHEHDIAMTWFLHVEPHHEWLDLFQSFRGQEMAVHGYRHRTFRGYEANIANMGEAKHLLERTGFAPTGYAAPNGTWHPALARAIEDHGFDYSSEFSLGYDDLPFFPWVQHYFSDVMQVPVHPVCIGSMIRSKATATEMKNYFRRMTDFFRLRNEPVIFYHHPGHEHFEVMADTFAYAGELHLPNLTLGDYARWWRTRANARYTAVLDGTVLRISSDERPRNVRLCVDGPDNRRGFIADDGETSMESIKWQGVDYAPIAPPADLRAVRSLNMTSLRHSIEDFNYRIRQ
jgi:hypothetical protein